MIANRGTLKREQDSILTDLQANAFFDTVAMVCADDGDIESLVNQALLVIMEKGGKAGLTLIIHQPEGAVSNREAQKSVSGLACKPYYDPIKIRVSVAEEFITNRDATSGTGIPALTVIEAVMQVLHRPVSDTNPIPRSCDGPYPLPTPKRGDGLPDTTSVGYYCDVTTEGYATALAALPTDAGV